MTLTNRNRSVPARMLWPDGEPMTSPEIVSSGIHTLVQVLCDGVGGIIANSDALEWPEHLLDLVGSLMIEVGEAAASYKAGNVIEAWAQMQAAADVLHVGFEDWPGASFPSEMARDWDRSNTSMFGNIETA